MLNLKTPKGTLDLNPQQTYTFNCIVNKVKKVFETHGGLAISTPTFEIRDILMNKYGEDSKLIYNLEDQGGDICSLRYDLTVPFSRYLCTNKIQKMRRYQIGNVFRRDNPSFKTGRLRELTQADFDICGTGLPMVNDAEILRMIYDILISFDLPYEFVIKINDRRILFGLLKCFGIPNDLLRTACSTIDKVGKLTTEEICDELLTKGINEDAIVRIKECILEQKEIQPENILIELRKCYTNEMEKINLEEFNTALNEFELLFKYLNVLEVGNVMFDLSLARGLDYYTGLIVEACYKGVDIGSVAGGGRYDNLCGSLSEGTLNVPCVGFSMGISRIFSIYPLSELSSDVFVGSAFGLNELDRMEILSILWKNGIRAETFSKTRVNYNEQIEYAKNHKFKVVLFTGNNEVSNNVYSLVYLKTMEKVEINREEFKKNVIKIVFRD